LTKAPNAALVTRRCRPDHVFLNLLADAHGGSCGWFIVPIEKFPRYPAEIGVAIARAPIIVVRGLAPGLMIRAVPPGRCTGKISPPANSWDISLEP